MNERIAQYFSKTVADYDTVADSVVMKNNELHSELLKAIEREKSEELRILDLGCGTGHGVELLLNVYTNAHITAIDISSSMIERCQQQTKSFGERVKLIHGDFCTLPLEGPYDIVVSAVAIHNIADQQKVDLFKAIFESLVPGGVFINGDFVKGENKFMEQQTGDLYRRYITDKLGGDELEVWLRHIVDDDKPMRLSDQFNTLLRIGFDPVELHWLYVNEAVYSARRPTIAV